jgi:hypothetical protein
MAVSSAEGFDGDDRWFELPPPPDIAHEGQSVTWAGDRLFVWGGVRWDGNEPTILGDGWLWSPP